MSLVPAGAAIAIAVLAGSAAARAEVLESRFAPDGRLERALETFPRGNTTVVRLTTTTERGARTVSQWVDDRPESLTRDESFLGGSVSVYESPRPEAPSRAARASHIPESGFTIKTESRVRGETVERVSFRRDGEAGFIETGRKTEPIVTHDDGPMHGGQAAVRSGKTVPLPPGK